MGRSTRNFIHGCSISDVLTSLKNILRDISELLDGKSAAIRIITNIGFRGKGELLNSGRFTHVVVSYTIFCIDVEGGSGDECTGDSSPDVDGISANTSAVVEGRERRVARLSPF